MEQKLSVIIIVRNEERDLPACLESLRSLNAEVIVVDSGSSDGTLHIAREFTPLVYSQEWLGGFSQQKQWALSKATKPWVLNLDADERLTPELQQEINGVVESPDDHIAGYEIPFRNYFFGQRLRFGAGSCEKHLRLFRREKSSYGTQAVHESIVVDGKIGRLSGAIDHLSYHDVAEYLQKCNNYTSMIAERKFKQGDRFSAFHHLRLPFEFFVRYFLKLGFLDGSVGFTYATLSAYYVWLKFLKLRDLEKDIR